MFSLDIPPSNRCWRKTGLFYTNLLKSRLYLEFMVRCVFNSSRYACVTRKQDLTNGVQELIILCPFVKKSIVCTDVNGRSPYMMSWYCTVTQSKSTPQHTSNTKINAKLCKFQVAIFSRISLYGPEITIFSTGFLHSL